VAAANLLDGTERIRALLDIVDPVLAGDGAVVELIEDLCGTFGELAVSR
jgi:fructuronate reductase